MFGKATGNAHNIQRSETMASELTHIGIQDTPVNRALLQSHFEATARNPGSIVGTELRSYILNGETITYTATTRESFFMGPGGGVIIRTVWDDNRLLTIIIKGGF